MQQHLDFIPTVLTGDDANLDGMVYPFLDGFANWRIQLTKLNAMREGKTAIDNPTLRWVKDDKVLDLAIEGVDSKAFWAATGLEASLAAGSYPLSKRLARLMRPYRFWGFFPEETIRVVHDTGISDALWDGCGQVSRAFVERLADCRVLSQSQREEILTSGRFEVTLMHQGGQEKGDVLVVETDAFDFRFAGGSTKTNLKLTDGRVFVGLTPRHARDEMRLDIQSLINLFPFITVDHLLAWMALESELFLSRMAEGEMQPLFERIAGREGGDAYRQLKNWPVADFLASGGDLRWFSGMVKGMGRQHMSRLEASEGKLRFPIPGGRYYIFPASVDEKVVGRGEVCLEKQTATAWVNDADWLETIVPVLGGCDGDDAVWVLPFKDKLDGNEKHLLWRSPNQLGEYMVLTPTEDSFSLRWRTAWGWLKRPLLDSKKLPARIDTVDQQYGELPEGGCEVFSDTSYSVDKMTGAIERARGNIGILGSYCNLLMVTKATYGRLPEVLPATLEAVIDGCVKTGADLTPVREWVEKASLAIARQGKPLPQVLHKRLKGSGGLVASKSHWLDVLLKGVADHKECYWRDVEWLAGQAQPPLELLQRGQKWVGAGRAVRQAYAGVIRRGLVSGAQADSHLFAQANVASKGRLTQWPVNVRGEVLLGAIAYIYGSDIRLPDTPASDAVLWQMGEDEGDFAAQTLTALREAGLIGEPVVTKEGLVTVYDEQPQDAYVPVRVNGVWFNYLKVAKPQSAPESMGQVGEDDEVWAKTAVSAVCQNSLMNTYLETSVTESGRVTLYTEAGNLFGYVQQGQELQLVASSFWKLVWATAEHGNVAALLVPVTK